MIRPLSYFIRDINAGLDEQKRSDQQPAKPAEKTSKPSVVSLSRNAEDCSAKRSNAYE